VRSGFSHSAKWFFAERQAFSLTEQGSRFSLCEIKVFRLASRFFTERQGFWQDVKVFHRSQSFSQIVKVFRRMSRYFAGRQGFSLNVGVSQEAVFPRKAMFSQSNLYVTQNYLKLVDL